MCHFPQNIILMGVRWYVAYPLSYRHVEALLEERGVPIDHATLQRGVVQDSAQLEAVWHRRKRPVWVSWRRDATSIKGKGQWDYLYRALEKTDQTVDFLRTAPRDEEAARRLLKKAIRRHDVPAQSTIDGRAAHEAAIKSSKAAPGTASAIRKSKSLNNIVAQDHRGVTRITRPMVGFKSFDVAPSTLVGIALMHMLRTQQLEDGVKQGLTVAEQFYALAT